MTAKGAVSMSRHAVVQISGPTRGTAFSATEVMLPDTGKPGALVTLRVANSETASVSDFLYLDKETLEDLLSGLNTIMGHIYDQEHKAHRDAEKVLKEHEALKAKEAAAVIAHKHEDNGEWTSEPESKDNADVSPEHDPNNAKLNIDGPKTADIYMQDPPRGGPPKPTPG